MKKVILTDGVKLDNNGCVADEDKLRECVRNYIQRYSCKTPRFEIEKIGNRWHCTVREGYANPEYTKGLFALLFHIDSIDNDIVYTTIGHFSGHVGFSIKDLDQFIAEFT